VVSVISGGNIDVLTMSSLLNHGLYSRGRLFCFSVKLKDTPGQLVKIAEILSKLGANVVKLEHNQFKALDRLRYVALEVTVETNGHDHIQAVMDTLADEGYSVEVIY
jgi:threonine dehydratase